MIVKVCGITLTEQYKQLAELPVQMIGLNFYPKSKRYLSTPLTIGSLNYPVQKVGVFVNQPLGEVLKLAEIHKLDIVQLHGNELPEYCTTVAGYYPVIKAFGIDNDFNFSVLRPYEGICKYFLFDTKSKQYGGSGIKFNWSKLSEYDGNTDFLLSGGISITDTRAILVFDHPKFRGVDINSGFEMEPGVKNIDLIKEFKKIIQ